MLTLVVILAMGQVDVSRLLLTNQANLAAAVTADAELALAHMTRSLERADRVNLLSADNVQVRIVLDTDLTDLDNPANYRWVQYRYDATLRQIVFYEPAGSCTVAERFRDLSGLQALHQDRAGAPPGGEPPQQDSNMLELVMWTDALNPQTGTTTTYRYRGEVAIRAGAYTNIPTGLSAVAPPPGACT